MKEKKTPPIVDLLAERVKKAEAFLKAEYDKAEAKTIGNVGDKIELISRLIDYDRDAAVVSARRPCATLTAANPPAKDER